MKNEGPRAERSYCNSIQLNPGEAFVCTALRRRHGMHSFPFGSLKQCPKGLSWEWVKEERLVC